MSESQQQQQETAKKSEGQPASQANSAAEVGIDGSQNEDAVSSKKVSFREVDGDGKPLSLEKLKEQTEDAVLDKASSAMAQVQAFGDAVEDEAVFQGKKEGEEEGEESEYEMVEEEGEEEQDEMGDAAATQAVGQEGECQENQEAAAADKTGEPLSATLGSALSSPGRKKKMVRRKKKKKTGPVEPFSKTKGVQMPEWTEALEIEYMNQDQLKRVIAKLREDGMTEEDIQLGEDLYYKRAAFQMDKFIKLSEVRGTVNEALNSILDRMRKADELARKNRTEISVLDSKLKTQMQAISHLKRMDNGQNQLIKMQKDQEIKLQEMQNQIADWKYEAHVKGEERDQIHSDMLMEINRLKDCSEQLQQKCEYLTDQQQKAREHLNSFTEDVKETLEQKIHHLENQVKQMPQIITQQVLLVETMKEEISVKASEQFKEICSTLKVDSDRILEVEESFKEQRELLKQVNRLGNEVTKLKTLEDGVFQSHCFIERTLPMMIHHQVCEAVNIVAGVDLPEFMAFEKKKTDEVYEHSKLCEGIKPDIKKLRRCIEKFTECAWKFKIGSAPFTYGEGCDYWAEITPKFFQNYDKRIYHTTRNLVPEKKLKDIDDEKKAEMEAHINYLFSTERDNTKALITSTVAAQRNTTNSSRMTKNITPQQAQKSPRRMVGRSNSRMQQALTEAASRHSPNDYHTAVANTAQPSRKASSKKKVVSTQNVTPPVPATTPPVTQPLKGSSQVSVRPLNDTPPLKIEDNAAVERELKSDSQSNKDEADYGEDYQPLSGDPSMTHSQFLSGPSRVPPEVRIVNNVKVVHKVDKVALHKLKTKCFEFMSQGRSEFNKQLNKWQDFFDETHDDHYQMESRLEKLETLVDILTDHLEDMEARTPGQTDEQESPDKGESNSAASYKRKNSFFKDQKRNYTMAFKNGNRSMSLYGNNELGAIEESNAENDDKDKQSRPEDLSGHANKSSTDANAITIRNMSVSEQSDMSNTALMKALDATTPVSTSALRNKTLATDGGKAQTSQKKQVTINTQNNEVAGQAPAQPVDTGGLLSPARKQRLTKLEDTQKLLNNQTASGARRMTQQAPPKNTVTTSSLTEDSVSSLNTVEKKENSEAEQKVAGNSFHFAKEFQRQTLSRHELTIMVQKKFDQIWEKTEGFQQEANRRYTDILKNKDAIRDQNMEFQKQVLLEQKMFTENSSEYMKQKGIEVQKMLLNRINVNEAHVEDFEERLKLNERDLKTIKEQITQEYKDFANNRKRWKSDFAMATDKAVQNMDKIRSMLSGCENQNQINTQAIKLILDAQMIEQIVQRQEIEDRKRLLVLAQKKDQEMLSTDLGVHARELTGPKSGQSRDFKHDRARSYQNGGHGSKGTQTSGKQPNQNGKVVVPSVSAHKKQNSQQTNGEDPVKDFADNACRVDPPILKVDRHCMNCANNKALTLNAIKVACLTHTQSAIPYQGKNYHVSEVLDVKAKVVAQCQRMLRENLFQTKGSAGVDIRGEDNERGFIITPLANTMPIKVETKIHDIMNNTSARFQEGADKMGSILFNNNSPTHGQSMDDQQYSARPHQQDSMYARYPNQGSPVNAAPAEDSVLEIEGEKILDENNYKSRHDAATREDIHILSSQHNVSTVGNDDLFSSGANLATNQSIQIAQKINRGASQMTHHKQESSAALYGRQNFGHIRFSSSSRIHHNAGKQQVSESFEANNQLRRSLFDQQAFSGHPAQNDSNMAALPDVQPQRGAYPQKFGNLDFEHMFESSQQFSSTKNSQVRQSSVLSGTTTQNMFSRQGVGMSSTRHTANRIGQSVLEDNNYRQTDGFKNMPMKKLAQKKHSELVNSGVSRPQTQENHHVGFGVKRVNSFGNQ